MARERFLDQRHVLGQAVGRIIDLYGGRHDGRRQQRPRSCETLAPQCL
jgi:hypothetical protein